MDICKDFASARAKGAYDLHIDSPYLAFIWNESITFIKNYFYLRFPSFFKSEKPTNSRMGTKVRQW